MSIENSEDLTLITDVAGLLIDELEPGNVELVASIITQYKRITDDANLPADLLAKARDLICELTSAGERVADFTTLKSAIKSLSREISQIARVTIIKETDSLETPIQTTILTTSINKPTRSESVRERVSSGELIDFFNEAFDCLESAETGLVEHDGTINTSAELKRVFRAFHNIKAIAGFVGMREISRVAHFTEALLVKVREDERGLTLAESEACFEAIAVLRSLISKVAGTEGDSSSMKDVVSFKEILEILSNPEKHLNKEGLGDKGKKVGELLVKQGIVSVSSVEKALERQSRGNKLPLGALLVEKGVLKKKDLSRALRLQSDNVVPARTGGQTIVMDIDSVDVMLRSAESTFLNIVENMNSDDDNPEPVVSSAFKCLLNAAMMRVTYFERVLKNAAATGVEVAKKESIPVKVVISDENLKVDTVIAHEILSPMIHIVRNSIVHGIEPVFERNLAAENFEGEIRIKVEDRRNYICVTVEDNGAGLNFDKALRKAEENGVKVRKDGAYFHGCLKRLFFMEKVSTAETVTELSGRGVGLDVVKEFGKEFLASVDIGNLECEGAYVEIRMPMSSVVMYGHRCMAGSTQYMLPSTFLIKTIPVEKGSKSVKWEDLEIPVIKYGGVREEYTKVALARRADAGVVALGFNEIQEEPELFYMIKRKTGKESGENGGWTAVSETGDLLEVLNIDGIE